MRVCFALKLTGPHMYSSIWATCHCPFVSDVYKKVSPMSMSCAELKRAEIADIGIINHLLPAVRQDWSFGLRGLVSESRGHARWGFCSRPSASVYFWAAHLDGFRLLRDSSKANCPPKSMKVKFRWVHFLSVERDNVMMLFRCIFRWCNFISIYK